MFQELTSQKVSGYFKSIAERSFLINFIKVKKHSRLGYL